MRTVTVVGTEPPQVVPDAAVVHLAATHRAASLAEALAGPGRPGAGRRRRAPLRRPDRHQHLRSVPTAAGRRLLGAARAADPMRRSRRGRALSHRTGRGGRCRLSVDHVGLEVSDTTDAERLRLARRRSPTRRRRFAPRGPGRRHAQAGRERRGGGMGGSRASPGSSVAAAASSRADDGRAAADGDLRTPLSRRTKPARPADLSGHERGGQADERIPAPRVAWAPAAHTRDRGAGPSRRRTVPRPCQSTPYRRSWPELDLVAGAAVDPGHDLRPHRRSCAGPAPAGCPRGGPGRGRQRRRAVAPRPASAAVQHHPRGRSGTSPSNPTCTTTGGIAGIVRSTYGASAKSRRGSMGHHGLGRDLAAGGRGATRPSRTTRSRTSVPVSVVTPGGQPVGEGVGEAGMRPPTVHAPEPLLDA